MDNVTLPAMQDDIIQESKSVSYICSWFQSILAHALSPQTTVSQSNDTDSYCYSSSFHNLNFNFNFMVRFIRSYRSPRRDNLVRVFMRTWWF